jgi:hypothetical protein
MWARDGGFRKCGECGVSTSGRKIRGLWNNTLCEKCGEEDVEDDPPSCETCKKPVWSNNDVYQKVHNCIVCQDCFDENEKAHEDNDYCPICNKLTNTKICCWSRTCCVCLEMTFCDDCVTDCEDKNCSHDWETHCICAKCEENVNPPEPDGDGSGDDTTKCEVCGYVGDSVIVHDWGCVALCETCSNIDSEPHCPRTSRSGEAEQCEYCVAEWKERDEKDVNPPEPDGDGSGDE